MKLRDLILSALRDNSDIGDILNEVAEAFLARTKDYDPDAVYIPSRRMVRKKSARARLREQHYNYTVEIFALRNEFRKENQ